MSEQENSNTVGAATTRKDRKVRQGAVVSKSGDKSIVVVVESRRRHARYGKVLWHRSKFHVHDEENKAKVGDNVRIVECRPISRLKHWRLVGIEAGAESSGQS